MRKPEIVWDLVSCWLYRSANSLCCVLRYVLAFSLGAGPVPALLLPEIFGARIRAKAVSVSLGVHWVSTPNFFLSWLRMWELPFSSCRQS